MCKILAMKTTVTHMPKQAHTRTAMHDVRITAVQQTTYPQLMARYENPIMHACDIREGQQWISINGQCPEGLCPAAWGSMREFVESLANGKGNFYDGWMQNPMSAMISCNDGFRPFSFYLEAIDDDYPSAEQATYDGAHNKPRQSSAKSERVVLSAEQRADKRLNNLLKVIGKFRLPRNQIIAELGLKQKGRRNFLDNYLHPAMKLGLVEMAFEAVPNKPIQAYQLTFEGLNRLCELLEGSEQEAMLQYIKITYSPKYLK